MKMYSTCFAARVWLTPSVGAMVLVVFASALIADETPSKRKAERLKTLDRNGDGAISADEVSATLWNRVALYDLNKDGKLDAQEAKAAGLNPDEGKEGRMPGGAPASFKAETFKASNGQSVQYSLYVPPDAKEKLPVVLCLHGRGGNSDAPKVLSQPDKLKSYSCIIIAPGIDGSKQRWATIGTEKNGPRSVTQEVIEMLDDVIRKHNGDPRRVYITGQSMGGYGTWGLIAAHPEKFAAAVPVCGGWRSEDAEKMKNVSIWAFHGDADTAVPVSGSRHMIEALKAAGAKPQYTEYPGVGHNSWTKAYGTDAMWKWMFEQRLAEK